MARMVRRWALLQISAAPVQVADTAPSSIRTLKPTPSCTSRCSSNLLRGSASSARLSTSFSQRLAMEIHQLVDTTIDEVDARNEPLRRFSVALPPRIRAARIVVRARTLVHGLDAHLALVVQRLEAAHVDHCCASLLARHRHCNETARPCETSSGRSSRSLTLCCRVIEWCTRSLG